MDARAAAILDEWFGPLDADGQASPEKSRRWFEKDPAFDEHLRDRYGALVEQAIAGGLVEWEAEPESSVAKLLLLDQFTRNVFRDTGRMFAGDAEGLRLSHQLLADPRTSSLPIIYQLFVCLPLMHAESLPEQLSCIAEYERLLASAPAGMKGGIENSLTYARRHHDIVARFGRFPHRNAALGRATTAEEAEFLKTPGSSF